MKRIPDVMASACVLVIAASSPASADWWPGYLVSGSVGAYPGPTRSWCGQRWWTGMPVTGPTYPICGPYPFYVYVPGSEAQEVYVPARRKAVVLRRKN
jgi:hypothetical protein